MTQPATRDHRDEGPALGQHGRKEKRDAVADADQALWRAVELEAIARQYHAARLVGDPVLLTEEELEATWPSFSGYGRQSAA